MPSRIIREDILTSSRVDELDPPSEVFYRRLLSKCDDHGLYDARPAILRASLFPLRIDRVREADCSRWMAACQKAGLIVLYSHDGRPYLQVLNTRWAARSEPKYPLPSSENTCAQLKTPVSLVVDVVEVVSVSEDVSKASCPEPQADSGPIAITLTLNTGKDHPIGESMVRELGGLYPAVDVMAELRKMKGWFLANPNKKKTKAGIMRFVTNWLAREQDKSHQSGTSHETHRKLSPAEQVRAHIARADAASAGILNGHANALVEDGRDLRPPLDGEFRREP